MSCERCAQDPCICQTTKKQQTWIITHCSAPGCGVTIRYNLVRGLGDPRCKWCQAGKAYNIRPGGSPLSHK